MASKYEHVKGKAVSADLGTIGANDTPYVGAIFKATDGHSYEWKGWLTDAAAERTIASLKCMGCTLPGGDVTNLVGYDSNDVDLSIEEDPKYGKRVAFVNEIGAVNENAKMDDAAKKSFAAKFRGTVLRVMSGGPAKAGAPKLAAVPAAAPWQAPTGDRAETPSYLESDQPAMGATGTDGGGSAGTMAPGTKPIPF